MPRISSHYNGNIIHSRDPYSSDEESIHSYSQSSIPSRSTLSLSVASRKESRRLLRDREHLLIVQAQLYDERRRGRWMVCACLILGTFCLILFKDRWPEDFRGALIQFLDSDDRTNTSTKNSNNSDEFLDAHSSKGKNKSMQQYSRDDPASGAATGMSDYLNNKNTKHDESSSSSSSKTSENTVAQPGKTEELSYTYEARPPPKQAHIQNKQIVPEPTDEQKAINKEKALMEELEQHLENLSKYLKWNLPYKSDRDLAVFWSIPLTGVSIADQVLGQCYGLIQAADQPSLIEGHEEDKILNVLTEDDGKKYVNVNMGSLAGLQRAKQLSLTTSNIADVIRSSYLYETALLFDQTPKYGKCFTIVRNPIDRAVDVFRKLKASSTNPVFQSMTLEEYAKSSFIEDNWMVRFLSNELDGSIGEPNLALAKHILGRKCIVGLTEMFEESITRFAKYYKWSERRSIQDVIKCKEDLEFAKNVREEVFTSVEMGSKIDKVEYKEGTELHNLLLEKNALDMELYNYAKGLFHRQALYT